MTSLNIQESSIHLAQLEAKAVGTFLKKGDCLVASLHDGGIIFFNTATSKKVTLDQSANYKNITTLWLSDTTTYLYAIEQLEQSTIHFWGASGSQYKGCRTGKHIQVAHSFWKNKEILILSLDHYLLEIIDLASMETLFEFDSKNGSCFLYQALNATKNGFIYGTGFLRGESMDTFFLYDISTFIDTKKEPVAIEKFEDYSGFIKAGPTIHDNLIVYRDHEGLEEDYDEEDYDENPLLKFKGIYLRQISSGTIINKYPISASQKIQKIHATDQAFILVYKEHLEIIARSTPSTPASIFSFKAYSWDEINQQLLILNQEDQFKLISF